MKFLIVGLGSMGKRRIRNLKEIGINEIIGFDTNLERGKEVSEKYNISTFSNFDNVLKEKPNVMVISTPPDLHMEYAKIAIENKMHFFTEASVVTENMEMVIKKLEKTNLIGLPSCTMRYHPIVKTIFNLLTSNKIGKPLAFQYHSGQYLPDWHPWEDYRTFYVSKKNTGACREIVPFELIWLTNIFGDLNSVFGIKGKISKLDTEIDDIYNVLLEFKNGIQGSMTVDVISRFPYRQIKILGEDGIIFADWYEREVKYYNNKKWIKINIDDGKPEENYIHGEKPYIEEMSGFIKSIKMEIKQPYTFKDDLKILKILNSIEKSSRSGVRQQITN